MLQPKQYCPLKIHRLILNQRDKKQQDKSGEARKRESGEAGQSKNYELRIINLRSWEGSIIFNLRITNY